MKSFLKGIGAIIGGALLLVLTALVHLAFTALICLVFNVSLFYSFDGFMIGDGWVDSTLRLVIFWYGSYLLLNHYRNNLSRG